MEEKKINLEELKNLYENCDMTNGEIAKELNCSVSTVDKLAFQNDFKKYDKYASLTKEVLEDLYIEQHLSMSNIAKQFGATKAAIQRRIEKYGLKQPEGLYEIDIPYEELKTDLEQGMNKTQIAQKYNCSASAVTSKIKKYRLKYSARKYSLDEYRLIELHNKGLSHVKIAKELGCPSSVIYRRLRELGLTNSNIRGNTDLPDDLLEKWISEGKTYKEIAKELNTTVAVIGYRVRTLGLERPEPYSDLTYDALYNDYVKDNLTIKDLQNKYGYGRFVISNKLKEYGIERAGKVILGDHELLKLYVIQDLGVRKIHNLTKMPEKEIKIRLKELGVYRKKIEDNGDIEKLYMDENLNVSEITRELKCSRNQVLAQVYRKGMNKLRDPEKHQESIMRAFDEAHRGERSAGERELEKLYPTEYTNYSLVIKYELDLWYPEQKVAIEYNGDYFHSDALARPKKHILKTNLCEQKSIHLFNIFERFWKDSSKKPIIVNLLDNAIKPESLLHIDGEVKEVPKAEAELFIRTNNINYTGIGTTRIGTYSSTGLLLNLFTFSQNKAGKVIIKNFTTRIGYQEDYYLLVEYMLGELELGHIEVQCDRRYYDGEVFRKEGFVFKKNTTADYEYVKADKAISRTTFKKNPDKYPYYHRVYDCGKSVWELKV